MSDFAYSYFSAGAIIALGVGVEGWDVDTCMSKFKDLILPGFTPRRFHRIPGLNSLVKAHFHSLYETQPLQKALMTAYSDYPLFGGSRFDDIHQTKVAVVATSAAGLQTYVLSNYNRVVGDERSISLPYTLISIITHR